MTAEKKIHARVRQAMPDELSTCERNGRDMLFTSFGYELFQSKFIAHSEQENTAMALEAAKARQTTPTGNCF